MLTAEERFLVFHDPRYWKAQMEVNPATVGENFGGWADELGDGSPIGGRTASDAGQPTDQEARSRDDRELGDVLGEIREESLRAPALGPTDSGDWGAELGSSDGEEGENEGTRGRINRVAGLVRSRIPGLEHGQLVEVMVSVGAALREARHAAA